MPFLANYRKELNIFLKLKSRLNVEKAIISTNNIRKLYAQFILLINIANKDVAI